MSKQCPNLKPSTILAKLRMQQARAAESVEHQQNQQYCTSSPTLGCRLTAKRVAFSWRCNLKYLLYSYIHLFLTFSLSLFLSFLPSFFLSFLFLTHSLSLSLSLPPSVILLAERSLTKNGHPAVGLLVALAHGGPRTVNGLYELLR